MRSKVVKFILNLLPESVVNQSTGVISYGEKNSLPNDLLSNIASSGTATNCVKKIKIFIQGDGFKKGVSDIRVNPYQTADDLLAEIAYSQAIFKGFALNIIYRNDGEVGAVYYLDFEKIRRTSTGGFIYNKNFGKKGYKSADDIIYPSFDKERFTPEERLGRINWEVEEYGYQLGEIFYSWERSPFNEFYPIPEAWSGQKDIISDGSLTNLEFRNIVKGFRPTVVISTVGELDDKNKDERGNTELDNFRSNLLSFTGDEAATMLHLEASTKEGLPSIYSYPLAEQLDGVDKATDRVARKVCRLFGCPPSLVGLTDAAILGNQQAIANAIKILNNSILPDQIQISGAFTLIYPTPDWTIQSLSLIDYIPSEVISKLSTDEIRALGGYPPASSEGQSSEVTLAEKLGVGGTQSLVGILSDPLLSQDQKIQVVVKLFGLSEEDSFLLVTGQPKPTTTQPAV